MDVNDNKPIFSKPLYKVKVKENTQIGTKIITVSASDLDEGISSEIQYSFLGHEILMKLTGSQLIRTQGKIVVQGQIDYEKHPAMNCAFRRETKAFLLKVHTVKF